jgi:hypothetical protein
MKTHHYISVETQFSNWLVYPVIIREEEGGGEEEGERGGEEG